MGECGCGDLSPNKIVKIGDKVLAIEIYPGCADCGTGLMVVVHLFTPESAQDFLLEPIEDFKLDDYGYATITIPIIGPEDLIETVKELEKDGNPLMDYESLSDWFEDNILNLIHRGLTIRNQKTLEEAK